MAINATDKKPGLQLLVETHAGIPIRMTWLRLVMAIIVVRLILLTMLSKFTHYVE